MRKDSETEIDYLDFSYIVEIMKDTINDEKLLPSCIGLYGDWGSGKSSLMHMCKKQLEEQKAGYQSGISQTGNCISYIGFIDKRCEEAGHITDCVRGNRYGMTFV